MKKTLLFILSIIAHVAIASADSYNLTLDESIEIAKEKSYRMKQLGQNMKIAEYNLKSTTSRLKTHITLNLTAPDYAETVRSKSDSAGIFYSVKQLSYSGNLRISQPLPTDGNIYVNTSLSTYKDYYDNFRSSNLNTRIGLSQPLDILYGYSQIQSELKTARLNYENSTKAYKREELQLIYNVSSSYYSLLSLQKQKEIALSNLERQSEAYEISKNKYEAGLIREVDALQMEVDLAEAQSGYDIAVLNEYSSLNSFKELLGINLNDEVSLNSQLAYKVIAIDPEVAVDHALRNRTELREQDIQIELSKLAVKRQKVAGLPRGSIEAYYEQVGYNLSKTDFNINNSISSSYRNFLDRGPSFGIGFTISIPILDFGENKALIRAAKARLESNQFQKEDLERSIETRVRNLVAGISSNLKRLQLLEKNLTIAEKSFDITLQRYSDGDIDSQALALERNRLNTAYTSHLGAYIQYQLSLAELMQQTLYDFEREASVE